jgi:hypothetical protein
MVTLVRPRSTWLAAALALSATVAARADDPKAAAKGNPELVGTWKVMSAKYGGKDVKFPEGMTTVKHFTNSSWGE